MKQYVTRFVKYLVYFYVFLGLLTIVFEMMKPEPFKDFQMSVVWMYLIFGGGFALIFPLIGFGKKKVYLNKSFEEERIHLEKIMEAMGFVKVSDEGNLLCYRYKSGVKKMLLLYEDTIAIEHSDNPVIISGPQKELRRLGRMFDDYLKRSEE